jgi:hypothetical protein
MTTLFRKAMVRYRRTADRQRHELGTAAVLRHLRTRYQASEFDH